MGKADTYSFADVELDLRRRSLTRAGKPLVLQKKPLDLLIFLLENRDRAVSKDEILTSIWANEVVSESSLAVCVNKVRKAIGTKTGAAEVIETLHGFGYRFVATVEARDPAATETHAISPAAAALPGRDDELVQLASAWRHARSGTRRTVLVSGEAGIGKTALVHSFLDGIAAGSVDARVLRGDCFDSGGANEPFLPLLDAWSGACRGPDASTAIEILRRIAPGWLLQLPGLTSRQERIALQEEARATTPERTLRLLGEALSELARIRPVILVIEDLHWADSATLEALTRIARDRTPAPLLLVATLRADFANPSHRSLAEFVVQLGRNETVREVHLDCLAAEAIPAFVATTPNAPQPDSALCAELYTRTRGHPLFLRGAVRHLANKGRLNEVPPDLRRMIEIEIDTRTPEQQRLLEAAGTAGGEVAAALVAAAVQQPLADVEEALLRIVRERGYILEASSTIEWPDGTASRGFRFTHPYYGEVARDRVAKARQREWHERIAERLNAAYATILPGNIALRIARHFERAHARDRALTAYEAALRVAQEECSYERIEAAAKAALDLLAALPDSVARDERELSLRLALGPALIAKHGYVSAARENCERGIEVAQRTAMALPQFVGLVALSAIQQVAGDYPAARRRAEEMIELGESELPAPLLQLARGRLGQLLFFQGYIEDARRLLDAAIHDADHLNPSSIGASLWLDPIVSLRAHAASTYALLGQVTRGRQLLASALRRARSLDHPFSLVTAGLFAFAFHLIVRDPQAAHEHAIETYEVAAREGFLAAVDHGVVLPMITRALVETTPDLSHSIEAQLKQHERHGVLFASPIARWALSDMLRRSGRHAAALEQLDTAQQRIEAGGESFFLAEIHRQRAVTLAASDPEQAVASFERAIATAREQGARLFELRAAVDLAMLERKGEQADAARTRLDEMLGAFGAGETSPDIDEARNLASELATEQFRHSEG